MAELIAEINELNHRIYNNPNDACGYMSLAACYNKLCLFRSAVNTLQQALRLAPRNTHLYQQLVETIETAEFRKLRSGCRP